MVVAALVQACPHLTDQIGRHPAPFLWRIESDSAQPLAQGLRDFQRLLGLVFERVYQGYPRNFGRHVLVERHHGTNGIAHQKDQGVGHGPRGSQSVELLADHRRARCTPPHNCGVVHDSDHFRVNMPGPVPDYRNSIARLHTLACRSGPSGA